MCSIVVLYAEQIWLKSYRCIKYCDSSTCFMNPQVAVNNREREVKKRKSGKAKASYKDKA